MGAPLFAMLSAAGLESFLGWTRSTKLRGAAAVTTALLFTASTLHFARVYFERYPKDSAADWQAGMGEAFRFAAASDAERIFVSDLIFLPHIFVLFYGDVAPETYQAHPIQSLRQGQWHYTDVTIGRWVVTAVEKMPARGRHLMILPPRQSQYAVHSYGCTVRHVAHAPDGTPALGVLEAQP
jgi:hypothetical protein